MKKIKKSLAEFKGKFDRYSRFSMKSGLVGKEVEVLETHERYGKTLKEGEKGVIGRCGGFSSMYDLRNEVPVYFQSIDETIGVEYEKLDLTRKKIVEMKHKGEKKRRGH